MASIDELKIKTLEVLDDSYRSGRLTTEEHSWRKTNLAKADSVDALEALVEDLFDVVEQAGSQTLVSQHASQFTLMANRSFPVSDLGRKTEMVTVMGSSHIDLRALSPDQALTLELVTIMGDLTIEVPEGVLVRVQAVPVMGDCHVDPALRSPDGLVKITGVVIMGSLRIIKAKRPRLA